MLPTEVSSVHVAPELVDVQMFPSSTTAASLVPSLEDVMYLHNFVLPVDVTSVQVEAYVGVRTQSESRAASKTFNTLRRGIMVIDAYEKKEGSFRRKVVSSYPMVESGPDGFGTGTRLCWNI